MPQRGPKGPGRKLPRLRGWGLRSRGAAPRGPPAFSSPGPAAGARRSFPRIVEANTRSGRRVSAKAAEEPPRVSRSPTPPAAGSEPEEGRALRGPTLRARAPGRVSSPRRGLLRRRRGPVCRRRPFAESPSLRAGGRPQGPQARVTDRGCGPEASPPPRNKAWGDHSPAGAAVAAAVPEVPEGAPKLKAISKEQRTRGPRRRRSRDTGCPPIFDPAGKPPLDHEVPPVFWPSLRGRKSRKA